MCLAQTPACAAADSGLTKLNDFVYARIVSPDGDAVANAGVVILEQSVLVFDTHFTPEAGASFLAAVRTITPKPVQFVVNSHWHADHTHGNQAFPHAFLIGSSNARRDVLQLDLPSLNRTLSIAQNQLRGLRQEAAKSSDGAQAALLREQIKAREEYLQTTSRLKVTAPSVIMDDSLRIQDGKREVRILFLGPGHTDGDIVVFLPEHKIAFVGDLLFNRAIPNVQDAQILQWMKTLDALLKLDAERFVPGHGPIATKKDVEDFLHYFENLKALVQPAVDRGDSLEQATKQIALPEKYASYQFQNFFPSNVQKMFTETKALQQELAPADPSSDAEALPAQKPK